MLRKIQWHSPSWIPAGVHLVAGGSAPGKRDNLSPTLKGSHHPAPEWTMGMTPARIDPFRVGSHKPHVSGVLPPATE